MNEGIHNLTLSCMICRISTYANKLEIEYKVEYNLQFMSKSRNHGLS